MEFRKFDYSSALQLLADATSNGIELPYSQNTDVLAKPLTITGRRIENRILAQPIEGFDAEADGSPSQRSISRYLDLAKGGVGTIWMESISVNHSGRSNPHQFWLTRDNVDNFKNLVDQIHQATGHGSPVYVVAQLTHSGRYSRPGQYAAPICAFHNPLIPKDNEHIVSDDEVQVIIDDYIAAIKLAQQAGFDAVDVRACHGYLINEFFAAYDREGCYGGSFDNRMRFLMSVIDGARASCDITLGVRLNMYDGLPYPYGWGCNKNDAKKLDTSEPLQLVGNLAKHGIAILNVSAGVGAYTPHVIRPYDSGGVIPEEHPLQGVSRLLGLARQAKREAPGCSVVCSGLTWLRQFAPNVAAGGIDEGWFDLAGFGRQSIAYPDFANDFLEHRQPAVFCATCGGCTALIKKMGKELRCVRRHYDY